MLITESQQYGFSSGSARNALALLENMNYLSETEAMYSPAMVPVIESTRYDAHLVNLEDLIAFGESNGINDLGVALQYVCESSSIDPRTVAFTVHEENIIADPEVASLTAQIMNEGHRIAALPMNSNCIEAWVVDEAVRFGVMYNDPTLFNCIMNEDYIGFLEAEEEEPSKEQADAPKPESGNEGEGAKKAEEKADGLWEKVKKGATKGRAWLARMSIRLRDWAIRINENIRRSMAKENKTEATIWQKVKNKIAQIISWIGQKIGNAAMSDKFKDKSMSGEGDFQSKNKKSKVWDDKENKYKEVEDTRTYSDALKDHEFDLSK